MEWQNNVAECNKCNNRVTTWVAGEWRGKFDRLAVLEYDKLA